MKKDTRKLTQEEELQEKYEDALFALMMHKFAIKMGEEYIAENERLKNDPAAAVPEELRRKNLDFIRRYYASKERNTRNIRRFRQVLGRVAIAAVVAAALFGSAIAFSPDLRAGVMNLYMQVGESAASMQLLPEYSEAEESAAPTITLSWIPDGYTLGVPTQKELRTTIVCEDANGKSIQVSAFADASTTQNTDVENVDYYEETSVQGYPAVLVKKDGRTRVSWVDSEKKVFVYISSAYENIDSLLAVAENVKVER